MLPRLAFILMLALGVAFEPKPTPVLTPTPQPTFQPTTGPVRIVFGLTAISVVLVLAAATARWVVVSCPRRRASQQQDPEVGVQVTTCRTSSQYVCSNPQPLGSLGSDVVAWDRVPLTQRQ